jgi:hypothetical protein
MSAFTSTNYAEVFITLTQCRVTYVLYERQDSLIFWYLRRICFCLLLGLSYFGAQAGRAAEDGVDEEERGASVR